MRIGLCEKDLRGDLPANLRWMANHGIEGVQLWKQRLTQTPAETARLVADHGLEITAFGGGPNMADPAAAAQTIAAFRGIFEYSVAAGCRIVTAESKHKPEGVSDEEAWRSTAATVSAICDHAEKLDAVLGIECAGPCFIRDHDMWLELARRVASPALKVNYDPANIVWAERDVIEGVRALAGHIVHTHAKDIARVMRTGAPAQVEAIERLQDVPAGEGLVPFPAYLRALKDIGYDGWLTIEMHAGKEGRPADVAKSAANLRAMLAAL